MKTRWLLVVIIGLCSSIASLGQTCTSSTQVTTNVNITSITWVAVAGGASPSLTATDCANIAAGTDATTVADFFVDLKNGVTLSITHNVTIHGNFDVPSGATGDNSTIQVSGSHTLHVTGDLGDASNNNINYDVVASTDHIIVDGTLYGKNSNSFNGSGTITGGTLNVGNGATCGSPCPVAGGFTSCVAGNPAFCTIVTPVTLLYFSSTLNEDNIKLAWSTASELNFDYFNLEKSANGINFNSVANIQGHGTTNERHDYEFEDNLPLIGKNYYRLTSVDFDNFRETFKVIEQNYSGEKDFDVRPNPSDGQMITLHFNFESNQGQVMIYDNLGSVVGTLPVSESGNVSFANPLKSGIYLAKYSSPSFSKALRFLVK